MAILALNLGCGNDIRESTAEISWFNLDRLPHKGVDAVLDLEAGLPFKKDSVHFILARSIMEHIRNFVELMRECWRVLVASGQIIIVVPCFPCRAAVADPSHVRFFVPETFEHFVENGLGFDSNGMAGKFRYVQPIERVAQDRPEADHGTPGSYYTELICRLGKVLK